MALTKRELPSAGQIGRRYGSSLVLVLILAVLPLVSSSYMNSLFTKCLIFALYAMSLDILIGYTGLLSLGHAGFFGAGAIVIGVLQVRFGITSFWLSVLLVVVIVCAIAAVIGFIALRVSGTYFLLLTFALSQLLYSVIWQFDWFHSGGTQGLPGIIKPTFGILDSSWTSLRFYYLVLVVGLISYWLLHRFVRSPFGRALEGIRECEPRMKALGYDTWLYKYIAFVVGAVFAGIAGMLLAYYKGMALAGDLGVMTSALAMLMVIIGGAGTLYGAWIGAFVVTLVEFYAGQYTPERWPIILGLVFVASIMWLRGGIAVRLVRVVDWCWERFGYGRAKG